MKSEPQLIITFYTTAEAMATEQASKDSGLPGRLIPAPRRLSAGCGLAWSAPPQSEAAWREALTARGIEYDQLRVLQAKAAADF